MHKVFIKTDVYLKGSTKIQRQLTTRSAATEVLCSFLCVCACGGRGLLVVLNQGVIQYYLHNGVS